MSKLRLPQDLEGVLGSQTVQVMAVSKTQPSTKIVPFLEQGYRLFGESKVQEATAKWPSLLERYPDCRLHLIGSLQSNKINQALRLFHGIEVIDRPSLVDAIIKILACPTTKTQEFLIQVNIGCEPQKSGILPEDFPGLLAHCATKNLPISGLMCIPPADQDPTSYFQALHQLATRHGLETLSMGMSQDYQAALACGSTRIRLGTALFGSR